MLIETDLILLHNLFQELDDLETCCRVESARWLIQEEDLWSGNQLACDT